MNRLQNWLDGIGASKDLIDLAGSRTLQRLWDECDRGDLMLWLLRRMAGKPGWPTLQTVVGLCCDCAELAKEGWRRPAPAKCIATLRAWCRGEATLREVFEAADTVHATHGNRWAASAAYAAAYAAAAAYETTESAAAYAAYTACTVAAAISGCYVISTNYPTLRKCAEIVRAAVPTLPDIKTGRR